MYVCVNRAYGKWRQLVVYKGALLAEPGPLRGGTEKSGTSTAAGSIGHHWQINASIIDVHLFYWRLVMGRAYSF